MLSVPGHGRRCRRPVTHRTLLFGLLLAVSSCLPPCYGSKTAGGAGGATVCIQGSSCSALDQLPATQQASAAVAATNVAASSSSPPAAAAPWSSRRGRQLLQSSATVVNNVCSSSSSSFGSPVDPSSVLQVAAGLLGDSRLQITDARFTGSCEALGAAVLGPRHTFGAIFPAAVVLSTGDVQQGAGDTQDPMHTLSTDLQKPGDASMGAYTHDAAVLEIDLVTSPAVGSSSGQQLVLNYMFGSEEYGSKNPNPDALSITIRAATSHATSSSSNSGGDSGVGVISSSMGIVTAADLTVLPGGGRIQPPSAVTDSATGSQAVQVFSNSGGRYRTALDGFTQVVPSQGFTVQPGSSYTLRIAVADANHGLVDSLLMLPAGTLRLVRAPTAAAGGPYAVAPNSKLSLHGAKSFSPNGAILSYRWSVTPFLGSSSSRLAEPEVLTATGASAAVGSPSSGAYNVTLEVWDVLGGYASSTTGLSVDPANVLNWWTATPGFAAPPPAAAPRPTAALSVNGTRGAETLLVKARSDGPAVVDLDGSGSHDSKGSPLVFTWTVTQTEPVVKEVEVLVGLVQPPRLLQSLDPGVYLVNLDVSGPGGISSKQVLLTVAANSPPIAIPGGPYTATVGKPVVVDGQGSTDPDRDPLTYSWTLSRAGSVIGRYNGSTLSMTLNKPGTYAVQLTVRDDRGGASLATTDINSYYTVPSPPPPPPPMPPVPTGQRSVASIGGATAAGAGAAPASLPNARFSAASLPQAAAEPAGFGLGGYYPAVAPASMMMPQQQGSYMMPTQQAYQPQQQQQVLQGYQPQQQQQAMLAAGYPMQQQQQQQLLPQGYQMSAGQQLLQPVAQQYASAPGGSYMLPQGAAGYGAQLQPPAAVPPQGIRAAGAAPPPPLGMCLFTDGKPNYNPYDAQAALEGKLPNAYWGPCGNPANGFAAPPGIPTAPALPAAPPAPAPPPVAATPAAAAGSEPVATTTSSGVSASITAASVSGAEAAPATSMAVIRAPEAFVKAQGPATQVYLDAGSSVAAPGRSVVAYHWTVTSKADNSVITSVDGQRTPVWLAPGEYTLSLKITDTAGQTATAEQGFALGEVAKTLAHISSPAGFVIIGDDDRGGGGSADVQLSASGSAAGPGKSITGYTWSVIRLPDNSQVATGKGPAAALSLPGGSYSVQLRVEDSAGGSATATQDFWVGSKGSTGTTAVITAPSSLVQGGGSAAGGAELAMGSGDAVDSRGSAIVNLDASGSMPARSDSSIRQYVWAVLSMPARQPVANATGRVASVRLPPGAYQVGLLVLDADGGTATARKSFVVQLDPLATNRAPSIPSDLALDGVAGGSVDLSALITDPDGDSVSVSWSLLDQVSGQTVSGKGTDMSLAGVGPGSYLVLVTAVDARGAATSSTGRLTVGPHISSMQAAVMGSGVSVAAHNVPGSRSTRSAGQHVRTAAGAARSKAAAASAARSSPAAVASIFSGPESGPKKLPVLSMPQGSVLALDAAAFHLLVPPSAALPTTTAAGRGTTAAKVKSYAWELQQRGTGQQVATVYGRMGRFELSNLDAYNIKLAATDTDGQEFTSTGSVRVLDSNEAEGGLAQALSQQNPGQQSPLPVVSVSGQCGPFKARQYAAAVLECPALQLGGLDPAALQWAWKITPTAGPAAAAAAADGSDNGGHVLAKLGQSALFLGLQPGVYRVELAVGVGGPPSSTNTAYYLATLLQVSPTKQLELVVPPSAVCAGQPVSLEAPDLLLPPDEPQPELAWRVTRAQPATLLAAAMQQRPSGAASDDSSDEDTDGDDAGQQLTVLQGTGKTFGLTVQPGRYDVLLLAKLPDGSVLQGQGVIKAKACVGCKQGIVDIPVPQGTCSAAKTQAVEIMSGVLPQGLEVEFAEGTDLTPGLRNVTIVARLGAGSSRGRDGAAAATAGGGFKGPSCRALVRFRDAEPPTLSLLHEDGLCLAPPNARWSCWHAHQLVSIADNCQAGQAALSFKVSCSSSGTADGADGDSSSDADSNCQVLPDGRACVRAVRPGQVTLLSVAARDGSGNIALPAQVAVRVHSSSSQHPECSRPELGKPVVVKVSSASRSSSISTSKRAAAAAAS